MTDRDFLTAWATSDPADPAPWDGWRDPVADPPGGYEDVLVILPDHHGVGVAYLRRVGRSDDGWCQQYPPSSRTTCRPLAWRPMPARPDRKKEPT